jgi:hypothetical protein
VLENNTLTSRGMNFSSFEFHDRGVKKNKRTLLKERRKCEMTTITMLKPDCFADSQPSCIRIINRAIIIILIIQLIFLKRAQVHCRG